MLLDRMVNLLTRGCVVPVVKYIKQCCQKDDTDISLIRYFVTEVFIIILKVTFVEFIILFLLIKGSGNNNTPLFTGIRSIVPSNG